MPAAAVLICLVIGIADGDTLTARCELPAGAGDVRLAQDAKAANCREATQAVGVRRHRLSAELLKA